MALLEPSFIYSSNVTQFNEKVYILSEKERTENYREKWILVSLFYFIQWSSRGNSGDCDGLLKS